MAETHGRQKSAWNPEKREITKRTHFSRMHDGRDEWFFGCPQKRWMKKPKAAGPGRPLSALIKKTYRDF